MLLFWRQYLASAFVLKCRLLDKHESPIGSLFSCVLISVWGLLSSSFGLYLTPGKLPHAGIPYGPLTTPNHCSQRALTKPKFLLSYLIHLFYSHSSGPGQTFSILGMLMRCLADTLALKIEIYRDRSVSALHIYFPNSGLLFYAYTWSQLIQVAYTFRFYSTTQYQFLGKNYINKKKRQKKKHYKDTSTKDIIIEKLLDQTRPQCYALRITFIYFTLQRGLHQSSRLLNLYSNTDNLWIIYSDIGLNVWQGRSESTNEFQAKQQHHLWHNIIFFVQRFDYHKYCIRSEMAMIQMCNKTNNGSL